MILAILLPDEMTNDLSDKLDSNNFVEFNVPVVRTYQQWVMS